MKWEELKMQGNLLYKSGVVEPIDLYKSGGLLRDFAVGSIMKYAFRNREKVRRRINLMDIRKIIHYAEILISLEEERHERESCIRKTSGDTKEDQKSKGETKAVQDLH